MPSRRHAPSPRIRLTVALLALLGTGSACGGDDTKLKVTGLEPRKGDSHGQTYVNIRGNRFTKDGPRSVRVFFGQNLGHSPRFVNDSELVVISPGGKAGEKVDVKIEFDPGGQIVIEDGFEYVEKAAPVRVEDLGTPKK